MDAKELVQDSSAISDIVTARKVDAVSAGIVKDDESQKLSVLTKREDALGVRTPRKRDKANRTARAKQAVPASSSGAEPKDLESSNEYAEPTDAKDKALRARQIAMREAVSELDDTDEFEGTQGAYDAGRTTKRAASYARNARKSDAASAAGKVEGSAKRASALGAKKSGAARASGASGAQAQATQHAAAQAAGTAVKASASTSGSTAVAGTLGARGKPIHPQCHRIHAVFHTAHVPAFPIKPSTSLPYAVPSGISIRGLLAAYSQCAPAARKSGRRHSPWNGPGNAHRRVPENQDASASHGIRDAHRMR